MSANLKAKETIKMHVQKISSNGNGANGNGAATYSAPVYGPPPPQAVETRDLVLPEAPAVSTWGADPAEMADLEHPAPSVLPPAPSPDGHYYFTKEEALRLDLVNERVRRAQAEMRLTHYLVDATKRAHEQALARLETQSQERAKELTDSSAERTAALEALKLKYNYLDFSKITFDNETGKITILP